jgi:hypothetical protein
VPEGKTLSLVDAPVTTGGTLSLDVEHVSAKLWRITIDPHGQTRDFILHVPVDLKSVSEIHLDGKVTWLDQEVPIRKVNKTTTVEVSLQ